MFTGYLSYVHRLGNVISILFSLIQLRFASTLNFKNAYAPALFKRDRINEMIKDSKDNNELGRKMENNAKDFYKKATDAFDRLNTEYNTMEGIDNIN